ncbi:MAG: c-type cytochrome [Burkholderiales bacterium]|nr:MAG: c-type cytochrome [Burkholderiales bacterium]
MIGRLARRLTAWLQRRRRRLGWLVVALPVAAAAQPPGWPAAGQACVGCHAPTSGAAPRLAGLPADYLTKQLRDLRDGERPANPALQAAHGLDREAARQLARALAALPAPSWPASASMVGQRLYEQGDLRRGRPACQVCHGQASGSGPGLSAPPLQGQPVAYLAAQLRAWRDGTRRNSVDDLMTEAARGLSDSDIEALSRHLGQL